MKILKIILLLLVPLMFTLCKAQKNTKQEHLDTPYTVCDDMPMFGNGAKKSLDNWLKNNIIIPENYQSGGSSVIQFIIERDGSVSNVEIYKSLNHECDAEAIRLISSLPKWTPGMHKGKTVRVIMRISVSFTKPNFIF